MSAADKIISKYFIDQHGSKKKETTTTTTTTTSSSTPVVLMDLTEEGEVPQVPEIIKDPAAVAGREVRTFIFSFSLSIYCSSLNKDS
jgi:hypothetical protein